MQEFPDVHAINGVCVEVHYYERFAFCNLIYICQQVFNHFVENPLFVFCSATNGWRVEDYAIVGVASLDFAFHKFLCIFGDEADIVSGGAFGVAASPFNHFAYGVDMGCLVEEI